MRRCSCVEKANLVRQIGQGTANEVELLDLKTELERKEKLHEENKKKESESGEIIKKLHQDRTLLLTQHGDDGTKESLLKVVAGKYDDSDECDDSEDDSDSSDDEDEEAELMRELEKIKQEREQERVEKEAKERAQAEEEHKAQVVESNPLTSSGNAAMKRRWNDDVVFKNQSRTEPETKKRFINDVIRSDFHRRFLNKYIQ